MHGSTIPNKNSTIKQQMGDMQDLQSQRPSEIKLLNDNKRLQAEVQFLNNINTRLGKELVKMQVKLGIQPGQEQLMGDYEELKKQGNLPVNAKQSFQQQEVSFLEPLFMAYDDKLEKLEAMLATVYDDIKEMDRKSHELVEENVFLRNELEAKCESILQMHKQGPGEDNMTLAFQKLEHDDLKERLNLITEENAEVLEKYKDIASRFNTMKVTLENKIRDHDLLHKEFLQQQTIIKNQDIELENFKHQKEILENKIANFTDSIAELDTEKSDLISKFQRSQNEIKLLKTQVQNLKKQNGEYEERKTQELDILAKDYDGLKLKERESFNKVIFMEREIDQLKEENRKIKKDLEQSKSDCDQMIRMMENYENKVQLFQKKEENMVLQAKDQREKVQEALLEKDKAILKEQQLQKQIQNIKGKNQEELQSQKTHYEQVIDNIKKKHQLYDDQKEQELTELQEELVQLKLRTDKQNKEFSNLQQENHKLQAFLKEDLAGQHDKQIADYERRVNELSEKLQLTDQFNEDRMHSVQMEKQQIEMSHKNLQQLHTDLKSQLDQTRNQTSSMSAEMSGLKSKMNQMIREKSAVLDDISKVKKHYEEKIEHMQEQYDNKIKDLLDENQTSLSREKVSRQKAIELLQNHDRMEEKMRFEYESRIKELEQYVLSLRAQNKSLNNKVSTLKDDKPQRVYA